MIICAFLVRAAVFYFYVQHEERYYQPDSLDYHNSALGIAIGKGMVRVDTLKPIFWRTPGYPWYLSHFFRLQGLNNGTFAANAWAHKAAIWTQIALSSCIPALVAIITLTLVHSLMMALIAGWLFVLHLGFVLASCYLLTEALAMILFFLFLIFFYKVYRLWRESDSKSIFATSSFLALSAISLGLYTWMRPNGLFIAMIILSMLLFNASSWKKNLVYMVIFASFFWLSIGSWYMRNYELTGKWFFWPGSGPYLVAFSAPKILRRVAQQPLDLCVKYLFHQVKVELDKQEELCKIIRPHQVVPQEFVCEQIAWPWIAQYPGYFLQDWAKEVLKTTFDLYASQLVAFASNSYKWDPLEEFLGEKLQRCIYSQPMHWFMRLLCWIELIYAIVLWIGIVGGFIAYVLTPLYKKLQVSAERYNGFVLWLKTGVVFFAVVGMTGGFGYARLRMPIEPLMVVLSLSWWYLALRKQPSASMQGQQYHETTLRSVAC
jgi:hypothetical protein